MQPEWGDGKAVAVSQLPAASLQGLSVRDEPGLPWPQKTSVKEEPQPVLHGPATQSGISGTDLGLAGGRGLSAGLVHAEARPGLQGEGCQARGHRERRVINSILTPWLTANVVFHVHHFSYL